MIRNAGTIWHGPAGGAILLFCGPHDDATLSHGWAGLDSEPLTSGDFLVVAHPDLVAGRVGACLRDVADLPWLLEEHMMERRAIVEREGIDFATVDVILLNTNSLVISAALSGHGMAVQPRSQVEVEIKSGALVQICEINQERLGYYMVTVPGRDPQGLRKFQAWLRRVAWDHASD